MVATKKKSRGGMVALGAFLAILAVYMGGQVLHYSNRKVRSEQVVEDTIADLVQADGMAIRDEVLVPKTNDGIVIYNYSDGESVSKTATVANIYQNQATATTKNQIEAMQVELDNLLKVQSISSTSYAGIKSISTQINNQIGKISDIALTGVVEGINKERDELALLMNRKQVALGNEETFVKRIDYLQTQLKFLRSVRLETGIPVPTPDTGYFTKTVDGYENVLTVNTLNDFTYDSFQALSKRTPLPVADKNLGKIVKSHLWYFGVTLDDKQAQKFETGDLVKLDFKFPSGQTIQAKVSQIVMDSAKDNAVIIFECKDVTDRLLKVRKQKVDIIFTTYSGLRVNSKALYHEQNVPGVYVLDKTTIHFKPINILKDNGNYLICKPDSSTDNDPNHRLTLLDSVIVESGGIQLKDGKQLDENTVGGVKTDARK